MINLAPRGGPLPCMVPRNELRQQRSTDDCGLARLQIVRFHPDGRTVTHHDGRARAAGHRFTAKNSANYKPPYCGGAAAATAAAASANSRCCSCTRSPKKRGHECTAALSGGKSRCNMARLGVCALLWLQPQSSPPACPSSVSGSLAPTLYPALSTLCSCAPRLPQSMRTQVPAINRPSKELPRRAAHLPCAQGNKGVAPPAQLTRALDSSSSSSLFHTARSPQMRPTV